MADVKYTAFKENVKVESPLTSGQFASKVVSGSSLRDKDKGDPFSFTSLKYPLDVGSNELGHFIVFYMLSANSIKTDQVGSDKQFAGKVGLTPSVEIEEGPPGNKIVADIKRQNTTSLDTTAVDRGNSVFSKIKTHTVTTGAISLYMPPNVSVSYGQTYENEATGLSGEAFATFKKDIPTIDKIKEAGFGALASIGQKASTAISAALSEIPGVGDFARLTTKSLGLAINPQEEQFYVGPEFRSFNYTFDFYPKNFDESKEVHNILWLLKYHMAPSLEGGAGFTGRFFKVPSEFEIFYYYRGLQNDFLNKISRCVLTKMDVKYGPDGQWSTFDDQSFQSVQNVTGAPPVATSVSLSFTESMFITKQQIQKGY